MMLLVFLIISIRLQHIQVVAFFWLNLVLQAGVLWVWTFFSFAMWNLLCLSHDTRFFSVVTNACWERMNTHFALNTMWKACVGDMCIIAQRACKACMSLKVVQSQTGQLVTLTVIVELRAQLSIWCNTSGSAISSRATKWRELSAILFPNILQSVSTVRWDMCVG